MRRYEEGYKPKQKGWESKREVASKERHDGHVRTPPQPDISRRERHRPAISFPAFSPTSRPFSSPNPTYPRIVLHLPPPAASSPNSPRKRRKTDRNEHTLYNTFSPSASDIFTRFAKVPLHVHSSFSVLLQPSNVPVTYTAPAGWALFSNLISKAASQNRSGREFRNSSPARSGTRGRSEKERESV